MAAACRKKVNWSILGQRTGSSTSRAHGTPLMATASARGEKTRKSISKRTRKSPRWSKAKSERSLGWQPQRQLQKRGEIFFLHARKRQGKNGTSLHFIMSGSFLMNYSSQM